MTQAPLLHRAPRAQPIVIPLSALLPPSSASEAGPSRHTYFPSSATAILGALPVTSPFHVALSFLQLGDLPDYDTASGQSPNPPKTSGSRSQRVLIITPSKDAIFNALEEEDEEWMRNHGGAYDVVERLKRVDVRYCPTAGHLKLLLALLTADGKASNGKEPQLLSQAPALVILWDAASLLMEHVGGDEENEPPEGDLEDRGMDVEMGQAEGKEGEVSSAEDGVLSVRFKASTTISSYLDLISAARSTVDHLSSLDPSFAPIQLIILEPRLQSDSALPIMPPQPKPTTPSQARSKRVPIIDGLRWMLGPNSVGTISPEIDATIPPGEARYSLDWSAGDDDVEVKLGMEKLPCAKNPHVGPIRVDEQGFPETAAWQWSWIS